MNKILLISELDKTANDLNEYLSGNYQVQLCVKQAEDVQAMVKIVKPQLVIICQVNEADSELLTWLQEKHSGLPIMAITTTTDWKQCKNYFQGEQCDKLFLPVVKEELLKKCKLLLQNTTKKTTRKKQVQKKILIVDDSPLMLRNIKNLLDQKYAILLATSGKQALDTIIREEPDLILLDYEMPEMSGKEVFEAMQEDDDMKEIPVVFLTSVSDKKVIYSILQLKPAGYILKPPDTEKLIETIQEILKK